MILYAEHLTKKYGNKKALDDVSFSLDFGVYGLLGPNGAGKTTLINVIAGIMKPTAGNIYYNGSNILELGEGYRRILGFLPQSPTLYKSFRAEDFLKYIMVLKGMNLSPKETQSKVDAALSIVNLRNEGRMRIAAYSGGMRQRLGIAQALLNNPRIILLDEPTAGLDPQERMRLRKIISEIAVKRTVIWSTHIVSDIEYISSEILVMQQGKLIAMKTPGELVENISGKVFEGAMHEPGARKRKPTLEDVYLYYFRESSSDTEQKH